MCIFDCLDPENDVEPEEEPWPDDPDEYADNYWPVLAGLRFDDEDD